MRRALAVQRQHSSIDVPVVGPVDLYRPEYAVNHWPILQGLILLLVANGTPVLATRLLGQRLAWPLDCGLKLPDGRPLLGRSKTVRGVLLSILVTTAAAPLLGLPWWAGTVAGAAAMAGDLLSSLCLLYTSPSPRD